MTSDARGRSTNPNIQQQSAGGSRLTLWNQLFAGNSVVETRPQTPTFNNNPVAIVVRDAYKSCDMLTEFANTGDRFGPDKYLIRNDI